MGRGEFLFQITLVRAKIAFFSGALFGIIYQTFTFRKFSSEYSSINA